MQSYNDTEIRAFLATASAVEEPVSFDVDGQTVNGSLFLPQTPRPCPAVLVAHGFTGSRNADARLLVWIARALAHVGIGAMLIDFRGSGESEGDFYAMTPESEIADARRALDVLQHDPRIDGDRLGMCGHSLGGLVTACTSGDDARIRALTLLAGVGDAKLFAPWFTDDADSRTENGWDAGGLEVSPAFRDCVSVLDVQARFAAQNSPALILHGADDGVVPPAHAELFAQTAKQAGRQHRKVLIEHADHCFRSLPSRYLLLRETLAWFDEKL